MPKRFLGCQNKDNNVVFQFDLDIKFLLEKGAHTKTTGAEHDKWSAAGHKAWEKRRANEAAKAKKK